MKEVGEIKDWFEAFDCLEDYVETLPARKMVLFLDEFDLIIDREDNVIKVCEMKFTGGRYDIGEREALDHETKLDVLRRVLKTQKAVHLTMATAHGLTENPNGQCVQSTVTLDDLFM